MQTIFSLHNLEVDKFFQPTAACEHIFLRKGTLPPHIKIMIHPLNQISNFSSNSKMAIYLESLSDMVHFRFNHVKELDVSHNCAKRQGKAWTQTAE